MAARENQGYLIAIILLVLLTVILAILTYFAFSQAGSESSVSTKLEQDLDAARKQVTAYTEQAYVLKAYLGMSGSVSDVENRLKSLQGTGVGNVIDETNQIVDFYETDMARYVRPTAENVEKNYRGLLNDFGATMIQKHNEVTRLTNQVEQADDEKVVEIATKDNEIEQVRVQLDQSRKDYATAVANNKEFQDRVGKQLEAAQAENKKILKDSGDERVAWGRERSILVGERNDLADVNKILEERLKRYEAKRVEISDGKVLSVATDIDTVYLDLGSADRLQLRQSFTIYDQSLNTFDVGQGKAKIEITEILGPHQAKARILDQDHVNPILTGDQVVTPTWDRGYAVPVALAGRFDLDGDGNSDLERLISIIRLNNGRVVAYHDENGKIFGEITKDTRYLVVGGSTRASNALVNQAANFEIQEISVIEYLNAAGVQLDRQTIEGTGSLNSSRPFKRRQPPSRDNGSDSRGSDSRDGSDSRGSDSRGSDSRGSDSRGSDNR